jgi:mono/diheme cytochrome c family protein
VAETRSDYEAFVASAQKPLTLGAAQWRGVCAACHGLTGKGGYGPNIQANTTLVSPVGLRRLLENGQNVLKPVQNYMPPVGRGWTDAQFTALMAFIRTHIYKGTASGG